MLVHLITMKRLEIVSYSLRNNNELSSEDTGLITNTITMDINVDMGQKWRKNLQAFSSKLPNIRWLATTKTARMVWQLHRWTEEPIQVLKKMIKLNSLNRLGSNKVHEKTESRQSFCTRAYKKNKNKYHFTILHRWTATTTLHTSSKIGWHLEMW